MEIGMNKFVSLSLVHLTPIPYPSIIQRSHKCLQFSTHWNSFCLRVSMAIIFSIINISISDKCTYICLHQYLCIFMFQYSWRVEVLGWSEAGVSHCNSTRPYPDRILIIGAFSCACFLLAIILRHFDGKCLNLLNMARAFFSVYSFVSDVHRGLYLDDGAFSINWERFFRRGGGGEKFTR